MSIPPFNPKPMSEHQRRYPAAIVEIIDIEGIQLGTVLPPTRRPENVFDFHDGVRIVFNREIQYGRHLIHISASWVPGRQLYTQMSTGKLSGRRALAMVEERFREISGSKAALEFIGFTAGKMIPHWVYEIGDDGQAAQEAPLYPTGP